MTRQSENTKKLSVWEKIKKANKPGPPENSISLRVLTTASLLIGVLAATSSHELSPSMALISSTLIVVGMVFSYFFRNHPPVWIKVIIALSAIIVGYVVFKRIYEAALLGNLPSLFAPLGLNVAWNQIFHSFDVPSRKDFYFSIFGSCGFIILASANALSDVYFLIFALWLLVTGATLIQLWMLNAKGNETVLLNVSRAIKALAIVAGISLITLLLVPPPQPTQSIQLPNSLNLKEVLSESSGGFYDSGNLENQPAQAAQAGSRIGIGGYLGFAEQLNTGIRARLSNQLVMRVRTTTPGYFTGETFSTWNGQSWLNDKTKFTQIQGPSPFYIGDFFTQGSSQGSIAYETYYLNVAMPNLVFYEDQPVEVWFPDFRMFLGPGDSVTTGVGMEAGTIYTVASRITRVPLVRLLNYNMASTTYGLSASQAKTYLALPKAYAEVKALTLKLTARAHTVAQKIAAIESWLSKNTSYSLNIAPLKPGQDAVDQFLFVTKKGYCEQISTSLAVMLRTIGIPTKEAVGYIPGSYNPFTGLYSVEASDAHAWVEVWFGPKYGWQIVDPTAVVPFSNETPAGAITTPIVNTLKDIHPSSIAAILFSVLVISFLIAVIRNRKIPYVYRQVKTLEQIGKKYNVRRDANEPISQYLKRLRNKLAEVKGSSINLEKTFDFLDDAILRESFDPSYIPEHKTREALKKTIKSLA